MNLVTISEDNPVVLMVNFPFNTGYEKLSIHWIDVLPVVRGVLVPQPLCP
jgi:hypothetical protein